MKVPLAMNKSPNAVQRAVRGAARPFALFGSWSGGRALVGSDPLVVVEDADDPFALLDQQPEITAAVPGATGGGWVGCLGYALGGLLERLPSPPRRASLEGFEVSEAAVAFGERETAEEVLPTSSIRGPCGVDRLAPSRWLETGTIG